MEFVYYFGWAWKQSFLAAAKIREERLAGPAIAVGGGTSVLTERRVFALYGGFPANPLRLQKLCRFNVLVTVFLRLLRRGKA